MRLQPGTWLVTYGITGNLGALSRLDCPGTARDIPMRLASLGSVTFPSEAGNPIVEIDRRVANAAKVNARFKITVIGTTESQLIDRAFFTACQQNGWQGTSVNFFVEKLPSNGGSGILNTVRVAVGGLLGSIAGVFTGGLTVGAGAAAGANSGDFRSIDSSYSAFPAGAPVGSIQRDATDRLLATQTVGSTDQSRVGQPTPPTVNPSQIPSFGLPLSYQIAIGATLAVVGIGVIGYTWRAFK